MTRILLLIAAIVYFISIVLATVGCNPPTTEAQQPIDKIEQRYNDDTNRINLIYKHNHKTITEVYNKRILQLPANYGNTSERNGLIDEKLRKLSSLKKSRNDELRKAWESYRKEKFKELTPLSTGDL